MIEGPGRCSGRCSGGQAEIGEDLGDHGGMFDACPEPVERAAMIFKMPLHWPETPKSPRNLAPRADEGPEKPPLLSRALVCLTAYEPSSTVSLDMCYPKCQFMVSSWWSAVMSNMVAHIMLFRAVRL
jgi:hypothetical protein